MSRTGYERHRLAAGRKRYGDFAMMDLRRNPMAGMVLTLIVVSLVTIASVAVALHSV